MKLTDSLSLFLICPSTETRKGVTEVPNSAPIIEATARGIGMTPEDVNATTIESKAPLLWSKAVESQPAKTPLVVSFINRTSFSAKDSPIITAEHFIRTIPEMKK